MPKPPNHNPNWGRVPVKFEARLLAHHRPAPGNRVLVWHGDWSFAYWNGRCFEDADGFKIYDVDMWAYPPEVPEMAKGGGA